MTDIIDRLQDPDYRNDFQHLRSWQALDELHDDAAGTIKLLRLQVSAFESAVQTYRAVIASMKETQNG